MINHRMIQFREYSGFSVESIAKALNITVEEYKEYESGRVKPDIDIIASLSRLYKVTVNEFYGYTPKLELHSNDFVDNKYIQIAECTLRLTDLSWDEKELILFYRKNPYKEDILQYITSYNDEENK